MPIAALTFSVYLACQGRTQMSYGHKLRTFLGPPGATFIVERRAISKQTPDRFRQATDHRPQPCKDRADHRFEFSLDKRWLGVDRQRTTTTTKRQDRQADAQDTRNPPSLNAAGFSTSPHYRKDRNCWLEYGAHAPSLSPGHRNMVVPRKAGSAPAFGAAVDLDDLRSHMNGFRRREPPLTCLMRHLVHAQIVTSAHPFASSSQ